MKKTSLAALIAGVLVLSGCSLSQMVKMAKEQELTVEPNPVEVHADTVSFEMSAMLPLNMIKKNKIYTIITSYQYGDEEIELGSLEFKYTDFPNNDVNQPKVSETFKFPYSPEKNPGKVVIMGRASNLEKTKYKDTPKMDVAPGIITTSRLVKDAYYIDYAAHGYNNEEELIPTFVEFFFLQGSSVLRSSEVRSDRGKFLDAFIADKNVTRTVTITGSHSPEGKESINRELADERADVIKDFYFKKMKRYDYKGMADSIKFETKSKFQDWSEFKKLLKESDAFSQEEKDKILSVIENSEGDFRATEKELQDLPYYSKLMKEIYPPLRYSRTVIYTVKPKKSDAEIAVLAKGIYADTLSADTLSDEELAYAATLTPLLDEKKKIFEAAIEKSDSYGSHTSLAAVYLEMAAKENDKNKRSDLVSKAIDHLKIALNKEQGAVALNNMGTASIMKGMYSEAYDYYKKAAAAGPGTEELKQGINAGLGTCQIKFAKYEEAVSSYNIAKDIVPGALFNKGLALLLKEDYEASRNEFANAIEVNENDALAYYCNAIAAAEIENEAAMANDLAKAIQKDPSLREKALEDLEFIEYKDKEIFKDAVK